MQNNSIQNSIETNTMTLLGKGQVTVIPDKTIIRLGVQTDDDNLTAAQTNNAEISQSVLQSLEQLGINDIQTYQYDINKNYEYVNGNRIDKGYTVRNILEIKIYDMKQVGIVIDKAVNSGANIVDFISFDVSDINTYYLEALNLAVLDAYMKAKSIVTNLGITINPIPRHIQENSTPAFPVRNFASREGVATTPIESGNKQIEASVTVEFVY